MKFFFMYYLLIGILDVIYQYWTFILIYFLRRVGVWRVDGIRYDRGNVVPKKRSGRHTKSYWSWISGNGPGALVHIDRRLNSQGYVHLLNDYLLPGVNARYPGNETIYVIEDNSAVHRAHIVVPRSPKNSEINSSRTITRPQLHRKHVVKNGWRVETSIGCQWSWAYCCCWAKLGGITRWFAIFCFTSRFYSPSHEKCNKCSWGLHSLLINN